MPLQADKLPISHNNVVGENIVLQLNILDTGVLTLVVQNSSPTRLRLVEDEPTILHRHMLETVVLTRVVQKSSIQRADWCVGQCSLRC